MPKLITSLKEWSPAVAAVCIVVLAALYAFSSQAEVAEEIRVMDDLALTLSDTADDARRGLLSPQETEEILSRRKDLETRMKDSRKPGIVVPQLSEAARSAGLVVLEIHPVKKRGAAKEENSDYPHYEVAVQGSYQQIADYMQGCSSQRIPVRVIGFRIDRQEGEGLLSADIKVEAFQAEDNNTEEKTT